MPDLATVTILEHDRQVHSLQKSLRQLQTAVMISGVLNILLLAYRGRKGKG